MDRPALIALIAVGSLAVGGGIGYAVGNSGSDGDTTTVVESGASGESGATGEAGAEETTAAAAPPTGEPVVLEGDSNQVFPKETYAGDYEVTWSFKPNSAPYLDVYGQTKPNPGGFGKEVLSTEADKGTSIVNLEGDYYMYVDIGGKDYKVTLKPLAE